MQADWAALKAGELGLIPLPPNKPEALGSGKFGTPRERMHEANLSSRPAELAPLFFAGLEEPQLAIASTQLMASTIERDRRGRCSGMSDQRALYPAADNTAISQLRRRYARPRRLLSRPAKHTERLSPSGAPKDGARNRRDA